MPAPVQCTEFGPFRLFASERRLAKQGTPVPLGSRALDILILLVERAGNVVTKQDLLAQVWPDITVEESSLRVHIAGLRKALGDGQDGVRYIANVTGRGYCFVGQISRRDALHDAAPAPDGVSGLPRRPTRMIGRDDDARVIADLLAARRFVTIHGPGGIGKTTVALAVVNSRLDAFEDGVRFLDLGLRKAPDPVPGMLASALGLMVQSSDPTPSIVNYLRDRRILLILDCCEHVIDSAAALAEAVFQEAPGASILATSREPLRAEGEHVYPLAPLDIPPEGPLASAEHVLSYPAARLFVERAVAGGHRSELSDADAQIVADICRKVDGIALALELAAGRVSTHGLRETAALLDSRLKLLWQGRRTALPRHQTLNATLDWSHELISERERAVLRRLSVLVGPFMLDQARAVAADDGIDGIEVVEALAQLVAQSLVFADTSEETTRYRLLDTTRAYAQAKLAESGEEPAAARRHALYYREQLARGRADSAADPRDAGRPRADHLANIRAALEWSFSEGGDAALGVELAAGSAQIFLDRALLRECRDWTERALAVLGVDMRGTQCELALRASLGHTLMLTRGNTEQARAAFERALDIAAALEDHFYQFRLLTGLHMYRRRIGDFSRLLSVAQQAESIAQNLADSTAIAAANVMLGVSHHLTGNLADARAALDASLRQPTHSSRVTTGFLGSRPEAQFVLARTLWMQGFPDQAVDAARQAERMEQKNPLAACQALILGADVFNFSGDWATLEEHIDRLIRLASEHSLEPFESLGLGFKGEILFRRGEAESGMTLMRDSLNRLRAERFEIYRPWLSCTLATGLAARGHLDQALGLMSEVIAAVGRHRRVYIMPELLRVRGDLLAKAGDETGAERSFQQSIAIADEQTALSWRLRTATSFARLRSRQRRRDEARTMLAETYARFTEGFATADLKAARLLLGELDRPEAGR